MSKEFMRIQEMQTPDMPTGSTMGRQLLQVLTGTVIPDGHNTKVPIFPQSDQQFLIELFVLHCCFAGCRQLPPARHKQVMSIVAMILDA